MLGCTSEGVASAAIADEVLKIVLRGADKEDRAAAW